MKHLPAHYTYALVVLLVGAAYIGSNAYFKQQELQRKEVQEQRVADEKKSAEDRAKDQSFQAGLSRFSCMAEADKSYNSYLELNGTVTEGEGDDAVYRMSQDKWDHIEKTTKDAKDLCLKQYPSD